MGAVLRTLGGIVRLRTTPTRPRRPVRPDVTPVTRHAFTAEPGPVPGPRRRRLPSRWLLLAIGVLLVLGAGLATAIVLTMPRLEAVSPSKLTNSRTTTLVLRAVHPAGISVDGIDATIDGRPIDSDDIELLDEGSRIELRSGRLSDGEHEARVTVRGVGLLHRTLHETWTFTVDTTPPPARIVEPRGVEAGASAYAPKGVAVVTTSPMRLTVGAEIGTTLDVTSNREGARARRVAPTKDTRRSIQVTLPEGIQVLTVAATDPAGNVTKRALRVLVDTTGPRVQVNLPRLVRDNTLKIPVVAHDAHGVELQVKLDGSIQEDAIREVNVTDAPYANELASAGGDGSRPASGEAFTAQEGPASTTEDGDDSSEDEDAVLPVGGRYVLELEDGAFEGRHVLEIVATDSLGAKTVVTRTFVVNSTEELGDATGLRTGAAGGDVTQLHGVLIEQGVVGRAALAEDLRTKTYGAQTRAAVQRFQKQQGMDVDGVAGADTIAALTLQIVVDRTSNTLTLYRVGRVVKTWGIATGSPEYPTPAGNFEIQSMQVNPTWTPPDSDWAKDAKPIPPGPDNPLGTRWMAIHGTVGIHGTNNPASIGGSVSHGCIRMHIPDVEELYEMVAIGTRVKVV